MWSFVSQNILIVIVIFVFINIVVFPITAFLFLPAFRVITTQMIIVINIIIIFVVVIIIVIPTFHVFDRLDMNLRKRLFFIIISCVAVFCVAVVFVSLPGQLNIYPREDECFAR